MPSFKRSCTNIDEYQKNGSQMAKLKIKPLLKVIT